MFAILMVLVNNRSWSVEVDNRDSGVTNTGRKGDGFQSGSLDAAIMPSQLPLFLPLPLHYIERATSAWRDRYER